MMEHIVEITALAYGGSGIGRIDGKVVFVPFTAPGDRARISITAGKKGFSEGALVELVTPSPVRQTPPCPVFGVCGGCALQHIQYQHQLEWKGRILDETLKRIGRVKGVTFDPAIPALKTYNYRSRAGFHLDGMDWGFFELKSHRVVDIDFCPIADPLINRVFKQIKDALSGLDYPLYALDLAVSSEGKAAASFHVYEEGGLDWAKALEGIDGLKGFQVWLNPEKKGKGRRGLSSGNTTISYEAEGFAFTAGISAFSQVNLDQNKHLIRKTLEYAGLTGAEEVLDLFCGVGNLTLPLASKARKVTGVEFIKEAVDYAKMNAARNSVVQAGFARQDASEWLKQNIKNLEKSPPSVVVLDPPRGGEPLAAKALSAIRPGKIIYVSCSPPTLARDIELLAAGGYRVFKAVLVDMFPQTYHIEAVIGLEPV